MIALANFHTAPMSVPRKGPNETRSLPDGSIALRLGTQAWTVVDAEIYEIIRHVRWFASRSRATKRKIYACAWTKKPVRRVWLHKLILGCADQDIGDHRDRNTLNNRRSNLRVADISGSNQNRAFITSSSGYRGVQKANSHLNGATFRATIWTGSKRIRLGSFATAAEAARAYDQAAFLLHGEFAVLNFAEGARC